MIHKKSYTVSCASAFRDAVAGLARAKHCNVADLARSIVLVMTPDDLAAAPDPGEPEQNDRETIVIKSGKSKGKPWRRKPRLQVRLAPGLDAVTLRKALGVAVSLADGTLALDVATPQSRSRRTQQAEALRARLEVAEGELKRLQNIAHLLAFDPVPGGIQTREQALYVLGFAPDQRPDAHTLRNRFRRLAQVFHPDGQLGSHERMAQVNAAMERLRPAR